MEDCYYSRRLLTKIKRLNRLRQQKINIALIKKSILYAKRLHAGQYRDSGEPYYTHPLEVAYMVSDYCFKQDVLVTAILHDTIEDTGATQEVIERLFGPQISQNVMDLTRIKKNGIKITASELVDSLLKEGKQDLLMIKLFDRLHNVRTINAKPIYKANKTICETMHTFIDLASFLNIRHVQEELTLLCKQHYSRQATADLLAMNTNKYYYTNTFSRISKYILAC